MVKAEMMNEMEPFVAGIDQPLEAHLHIHEQLNSWMEFILKEKKVEMMETTMTHDGCSNSGVVKYKWD